MTPLHLAAVQYASKSAKTDHLRILEILLQQKDIQPSLVSKDYNTALHYFARANAPQKPEELQMYNRVLGLFLERGLDFNYQNSKGETPLHHAALRCL